MKRMMAGAALLLAVGCAARQPLAVGQEYQQKRVLAAANSKKCMDAVRINNQVYERLNAVFIYDLNDNRQLTKMANRNYVTDPQVADLIKLREMIQPCYDQTLLDYGAADDRYAAYLLEVRSKSDENLLLLLNRQITVGERNVYLLETLLNNRNKFAEIDREVVADISRAHSLQEQKNSAVGPALEEHYASPAVTLPNRQSPPLPPKPDQPAATSADSQGPRAKCRFEGNAIRCD